VNAPTEERDDVCLACGRDDGETPLLQIRYRGGHRWICPQHLPILIHDPARLAGRLPGAEHLKPADHQD
jgi:hypothetical protein